MLNRIRGAPDPRTGARPTALIIEQLPRSWSGSSGAEHREIRMPGSGQRVPPDARLTLCGMEAHSDHMLSTFQHIERLRKFSLQTDENKSVCAAHTRILEAVLHGSEEDVEPGSVRPPQPLQAPCGSRPTVSATRITSRKSKITFDKNLHKRRLKMDAKSIVSAVFLSKVYKKKL